MSISPWSDSTERVRNQNSDVITAHSGVPNRI